MEEYSPRELKFTDRRPKYEKDRTPKIIYSSVPDGHNSPSQSTMSPATSISSLDSGFIHGGFSTSPSQDCHANNGTDDSLNGNDATLIKQTIESSTPVLTRTSILRTSSQRVNAWNFQQKRSLDKKDSVRFKMNLPENPPEVSSSDSDSDRNTGFYDINTNIPKERVKRKRKAKDQEGESEWKPIVQRLRDNKQSVRQKIKPGYVSQMREIFASKDDFETDNKSYASKTSNLRRHNSAHDVSNRYLSVLKVEHVESTPPHRTLSLSKLEDRHELSLLKKTYNSGREQSSTESVIKPFEGLKRTYNSGREQNNTESVIKPLKANSQSERPLNESTKGSLKTNESIHNDIRIISKCQIQNKVERDIDKKTKSGTTESSYIQQDSDHENTSIKRTQSSRKHVTRKRSGPKTDLQETFRRTGSERILNIDKSTSKPVSRSQSMRTNPLQDFLRKQYPNKDNTLLNHSDVNHKSNQQSEVEGFISKFGLNKEEDWDERTKLKIQQHKEGRLSDETNSPRSITTNSPRSITRSSPRCITTSSPRSFTTSSSQSIKTSSPRSITMQIQYEPIIEMGYNEREIKYNSPMISSPVEHANSILSRNRRETGNASSKLVRTFDKSTIDTTERDKSSLRFSRSAPNLFKGESSNFNRQDCEKTIHISSEKENKNKQLRRTESVKSQTSTQSLKSFLKKRYPSQEDNLDNIHNNYPVKNATQIDNREEKAEIDKLIFKFGLGTQSESEWDNKTKSKIEDHKGRLKKLSFTSRQMDPGLIQCPTPIKELSPVSPSKDTIIDDLNATEKCMTSYESNQSEHNSNFYESINDKVFTPREETEPPIQTSSYNVTSDPQIQIYNTVRSEPPIQTSSYNVTSELPIQTSSYNMTSEPSIQTSSYNMTSEPSLQTSSYNVTSDPSLPPNLTEKYSIEIDNSDSGNPYCQSERITQAEQNGSVNGEECDVSNTIHHTQTEKSVIGTENKAIPHIQTEKSVIETENKAIPHIQTEKSVIETENKETSKTSYLRVELSHPCVQKTLGSLVTTDDISDDKSTSVSHRDSSNRSFDISFNEERIINNSQGDVFTHKDEALNSFDNQRIATVAMLPDSDKSYPESKIINNSDTSDNNHTRRSIIHDISQGVDKDWTSEPEVNIEMFNKNQNIIEIGSNNLLQDKRVTSSLIDNDDNKTEVTPRKNPPKKPPRKKKSNTTPSAFITISENEQPSLSLCELNQHGNNEIVTYTNLDEKDENKKCNSDLQTTDTKRTSSVSFACANLINSSQPFPNINNNNSSFLLENTREDTVAITDPHHPDNKSIITNEKIREQTMEITDSIQPELNLTPHSQRISYSEVNEATFIDADDVTSRKKADFEHVSHEIEYIEVPIDELFQYDRATDEDNTTTINNIDFGNENNNIIDSTRSPQDESEPTSVEYDMQNDRIETNNENIITDTANESIEFDEVLRNTEQKLCQTYLDLMDTLLAKRSGRTTEVNEDNDIDDWHVLKSKLNLGTFLNHDNQDDSTCSSDEDDSTDEGEYIIETDIIGPSLETSTIESLLETNTIETDFTGPSSETNTIESPFQGVNTHTLIRFNNNPKYDENGDEIEDLPKIYENDREMLNEIESSENNDDLDEGGTDINSDNVINSTHISNDDNEECTDDLRSALKLNLDFLRQDEEEIDVNCHTSVLEGNTKQTTLPESDQLNRENKQTVHRNNTEIKARRSVTFDVSTTDDIKTAHVCHTSGGDVDHVTATLTGKTLTPTNPHQDCKDGVFSTELHTEDLTSGLNLDYCKEDLSTVDSESDSKIAIIHELRAGAMPEKSSGNTKTSQQSEYRGGKKITTKTTTSVNSNAYDDDQTEQKRHLAHLSETIAKLTGENNDDIIPEINQSITKLDKGNLVITTLTHRRVEEEDEDKSVPAVLSAPPVPANPNSYIVQDHKGDTYMIEDVTDEYSSTERQYNSEFESISTGSRSPPYQRIHNLRAHGNSGVDYNTAEEVILSLYNPNAMEYIENDERTCSGQYSTERYGQGQVQPYGYNDSSHTKHTTSYGYDQDVPVQQNPYGSSSVKTVKQSYEMSSDGPWVTDGKTGYVQNQDMNMKKEVTNQSSTYDNTGMNSMSAAYMVEANSAVPQINPYIVQQPLVLPQLPPLPVPQYNLLQLQLQPTPQKVTTGVIVQTEQIPEKKEETKIVTTVDETDSKSFVERPVYKSVALVKGPYESPKWHTAKKHKPYEPPEDEVDSGRKYRVVKSSASDDVREETMEYEVNTKTTTTMKMENAEASGSRYLDQNRNVSTIDIGQHRPYINGGDFVEPRYVTQKTFSIGQPSSDFRQSSDAGKFRSSMEVNGNSFRGNQQKSYDQMDGYQSRLSSILNHQQNYQGTPEPERKTYTDVDRNMKVIRGNILIKNNFEDGLDEYDDNINMFDNRFNMTKQNPLYNSDEDIYKRYEEEKLRQQQSDMQEMENMAFETVDRYSKSKNVTRKADGERRRPRSKQNLTNLLLSRLSTMDSKDIRQTIDVKHHHEDIYGDPHLQHADGTSSGRITSSNYDTVSEHVDLAMREGKAFITITVTAERLTPVDYEFHVWRKNQAIVTRVVEIDFYADEQRRVLYDRVMDRIDDEGHSENKRYSQYTRRKPQEVTLSSQDTLDLFNELMDATGGEGDKEDITVKTRRNKTLLPENPFLY